MRARGPRLGEILEQQGTLTRDQLLRALRNQKVVGGKLGTCLLEIDALPEEDLLKGLAEQQGAPSVSPEELRGVARPVLDLVPAKVARAHQVVPFRSGGTQIHVAMIDARDLTALDELAFVTGRRVLAHVASEARLLEALDRYYGVECPQRFVKLLDRLNRSRFLWGAREEPQPAEMLQWDPGLGARSTSAHDNLVTAPVRLPATPPAPAAPSPRSTHEFAPRVAPPPPPAPAPVPPPVPRSLPAPPAAGRPAAPPAPAPAVAPPPEPAPAPARAALTIDAAEGRLLEPQDKDTVAAALVDFAATRAAAVALFQVRKDEVAGWAGTGVDAARLARFRVGLARPSLFIALQKGASVHRGPIGDLAEDADLRALFGARASGDLVGLPLRIRERLVGVLLVAPAEGSVELDVLAELQRVVAKASIALELCIMRKKLRKA